MSASASVLSGGSTAQAEVHYEDTNTGLNNEWLGMMLFIVSEVVMFGAFFAQYFYARAFAPEWPPAGMHRIPAAPLALILTVILAISGITAHNAQTAIRRNDRDRLQGWLILTVFLGVVFLIGQGYEYFLLIVTEGFTIHSGIYGTAFFSLTGLHGMHVTGGVLAMIFVLIRVFMGHFTSRNHFGLEGVVLYWHFVDVVWFALYAALYVF